MEYYKYPNIIGAGSPPKPPTPRAPTELPEGVTGIIPGTLAVSLTKVKILDLLSEGEIDGLTSGTYLYQGTLGSIGYDSVNFIPYPIAPNTNINYLRSIYWDETPVVSPSSSGVDNFNFQSINLAFSPGLPNGTVLSFDNTNQPNQVSITRAISERIRGTDGGDDFSKYYQILNENCKSANLNIKVTALAQVNTVTNTANVDPNTSIVPVVVSPQGIVSPPEYGDVNQATVEFNIYYKPIFDDPSKIITWDNAQVINAKIQGKISYGYIDSVFLPLSSNNVNVFSDNTFIGWSIKVIRITPDSTDSSLRNQTYIDSLTEIYGDTYSYPNSAMVLSEFSAEYFSSIPARAYDTKLIKVLVPSNYDPILKVYGEARGGPVGTTDIWDGTFKEDKEWTDNPAWCFYDLLTNPRYGLGKYIETSFIDKWSLYEIGKYCDTLVDDGEGGLEPRFTCNLIINTQQEAYILLNNFASIFQGILYYQAGNIHTVQDSPKTPIFTFSNDNVENGDFIYSNSSRRARNTIAIVKYNDKNNYYKPATEYIEDIDSIRKYGIRETTFEAYGCTSRGQAIRYARWVLFTENQETETSTFTVGLDGPIPRPGDIINISDSNRNNQKLAGRIYSANLYPTGSVITLDTNITGLITTSFYNFSIVCPTYKYDTSIVDLNTSTDASGINSTFLQTIGISGAQSSTVIGLDNSLRTQLIFPQVLNNNNYIVRNGLVWTLESSGQDLSLTTLSPYRVIKIEEKDENKYDITSLQYSESKFSSIESGFSFAAVSYLQNTSSPTNLLLSDEYLTYDGSAQKINYSFSMPNISGVKSFSVFVKNGNILDNDVTGINNPYLTNILSTSQLSGFYVPVNNGNYNFRVYANNYLNKLSSSYAANSISISNVNPLRSVIISSLELSTGNLVTQPGTKTYQSYSSSEPEFSWQVGLAQTYVQASNVSYRITIRQPSVGNIPSNNIYYQTTGYNNNLFTFKFNDNVNSSSNNGKKGPFREYDLVVEAMTPDGNSSAGGNFIKNSDSYYNNPSGYDILYVNNPPIDYISLTTGSCLPTDIFCSQQWITPNGDVEIYFTQGNLVSDFQGGYLYSSQVPFTADEARGVIPNSKNIQSTLVISSANPIIATARLTGVQSAYIAFSPYDTFDNQAITNGYNISSGLFVSNTVRIQAQGINPSLTFQNWIEIASINNNQNYFLGYTGQGVLNVIQTTAPPINPNQANLAVYQVNVYFINQFSDTNYTIMCIPRNITSLQSVQVGTNKGNPVYQTEWVTTPSFYSEPVKYTDHFSVICGGENFFGVLKPSN